MTHEEKAEQKVIELLDKVFGPLFVFKPVKRNIKWIAQEVIKISQDYVEAKIADKR